VDGLGAASRVQVAPPPSSLGFDLPDQVDSAIVRALEPDREKRWPDVQTFTKELVGALDETTHDLPLSLRETVKVAVVAGDDDQKTALSDENQPTVVKTAPPDTQPSEIQPSQTHPPEAEPAAGQQLETSPGQSAAETVPVPAANPAPRKRRRGRWALAAVVALLVGGGAGYAGQWYLSTNQLEQVVQGDFSVQLPRAWAKSSVQSEWQAPGSKSTAPAFRVSRDDTWSASTPGVFVGVADSKLTLPDSAAFSCTDADPFPGNDHAGYPTTNRLSTKCGDTGMVLFERVVDRGDAGSVLIQVIVPGADLNRAGEIADSVKYPD
jgi:hypothetical protein